ncbi:hypothetical protein [Telmatospirillum sp.]|uniref:hypothetical protein n=1 Tax=Telmatospirillum sp. TaxID=2079197 RepID=UPI00283E0A0B|nr:hypothetical protein [Telmatospirillum sp.]MDR3435271.1 hypothetical protein [Telmatospirillum sp.]
MLKGEASEEQQTNPAAATLCHPDESVFFSCPLGKKTVSLCSSGKSGNITALAYRYGTKDHVENEYLATPDNGNRFLGDREPAAPRADVTSVWFYRGNVQYLVTECIGGRCPHDAGLTVLRDDKIVMNRYCGRAKEQGEDLASFDPEILDYDYKLDEAKKNDGMVSHTDLLRIEFGGNGVERIYPVSAPPGGW